MQANQALVDLLKRVAVQKRAMPAQIALAWLLAQIPGTRKPHRLDENLAAAEVQLIAEELSEIDQAASKIEIKGARGTGHEVYG